MQLKELSGLIDDEKGNRLAELAARVPEGQAIVELGSYKGKSTCYLASGASDDVLVYAFDGWDLSGNTPSSRHGFTESGTKLEFDKQTKESGFGHKIVAEQKLSVDAGIGWSGPKVGLLFIDADHSYKSVKADFAAWERWLAPDAIVAFDDYATKKNPGVAKVVHEIRDRRVQDDWILEGGFAVCFRKPVTICAHEKCYHVYDPGGLIGKCLQAGYPYEAKVLEYIYQLGLDGTAIDVGAGMGNHSLWLSTICGLTVFAFEPLDHRRLTENVALNNLQNKIVVFPHALGDREYVGSVTGAPVHVIGDTFDPDQIRIVPLDQHAFDDAKVSLIKIDVEGMESHVIRGAKETIAAHRPLIFAEAIDKLAHRKVAAELEPLGYKHARTFGATPLEEWIP